MNMNEDILTELLYEHLLSKLLREGTMLWYAVGAENVFVEVENNDLRIADCRDRIRREIGMDRLATFRPPDHSTVTLVYEKPGTNRKMGRQVSKMEEPETVEIGSTE